MHSLYLWRDHLVWDSTGERSIEAPTRVRGAVRLPHFPNRDAVGVERQLLFLEAVHNSIGRDYVAVRMQQLLQPRSHAVPPVQRAADSWPR